MVGVDCGGSSDYGVSSIGIGIADGGGGGVGDGVDSSINASQGQSMPVAASIQHLYPL